jgi:hypothetical protein
MNSNSNNTENGEINNDIKITLNKIQNNKNNLHIIINRNNDNINKIILTEGYQQCQRSVPNFSNIKKTINKNISLKNEIEQNIKDMKINNLLLKTLPNNYELYKKYLCQSTLELKVTILEDKMKLIFGDNLNFNNLYDPQLKPEVIWDPNDIGKITAEIMILKENKKSLENDLNSLNIAFNLALKGNPSINDSQLVILFRIKEENKLLKKELKKIKEKNNALQERIKKILSDNKVKNTNNKKENDTYDNMYTMNSINTLNKNDNNIKNNNYHKNDYPLSDLKKANIKPNVKHKINYNDSKDNSSLLNDISNGFTPQKSRRKNASNEK